MAVRKTTAGIEVGFVLLDKNAKAPTYGSAEAACFDVYLPDDIYLPPRETVCVDLKVAFEIPKGYRMDGYLRSGIAAKTNVRLANGVAKIDSDFTGSVKLLLHNTGGVPVRFYTGERVAQFEINPVLKVNLTQKDEITKATERAAGGLGSTGK